VNIELIKIAAFIDELHKISVLAYDPEQRKPKPPPHHSSASIPKLVKREDAGEGGGSISTN